MFKKFFYKNKYLFKILKAYWIFIYLIKIIKKKENFYLLTESQHNNEESKFLESLIPFIQRKYFVEIGFHFRQFNSIGLIKNNFEGKLVDTSRHDFLNLRIAKFILKFIKKKVEVLDFFVTPKNIGNIFHNKFIGFLSLDIDGNDFWILSKILNEKINPEVIIVEYNVSFLKYPITIPYMENFNMFTYHKSQCYHGASLTAFNNLLSKNGYTLVKSIAGVNAIFVNKRIFSDAKLNKIDPLEVNQECLSRNRRTKSTSFEQYDSIKHLPQVIVEK